MLSHGIQFLESKHFRSCLKTHWIVTANTTTWTNTILCGVWSIFPIRTSYNYSREFVVSPKIERTSMDALLFSLQSFPYSFLWFSFYFLSFLESFFTFFIFLLLCHLPVLRTFWRKRMDNGWKSWHLKICSISLLRKHILLFVQFYCLLQACLPKKFSPLFPLEPSETFSFWK